MNADKITQVLDAHCFLGSCLDGEGFVCSCGSRGVAMSTSGPNAAHRRHVASFLDALFETEVAADVHNTHKFTNEKNPDKCDVCGLAEIAAYCSECKRLINGRLYEHQVGHHGWGKEDN